MGYLRFKLFMSLETSEFYWKMVGLWTHACEVPSSCQCFLRLLRRIERKSHPPTAFRNQIEQFSRVI